MGISAVLRRALSYSVYAVRCYFGDIGQNCVVHRIHCLLQVSVASNGRASTTRLLSDNLFASLTPIGVLCGNNTITARRQHAGHQRWAHQPTHSQRSQRRITKSGESAVRQRQRKGSRSRRRNNRPAIAHTKPMKVRPNRCQQRTASSHTIDCHQPTSHYDT